MARCAESLESMLPFSQASVTHRYFFLNTYKHSNQTYCKDESTKRDWKTRDGLLMASALFLYIFQSIADNSSLCRSTSYNTCNSTLLQILLALPSPWPDFDVWFAGLVGHHEVEGDVLAVHLLVHPVPAHKCILVYLMSPA